MENSIISNIKHVYIRRLILPVIYLIFLAGLWLMTPLSGLAFPTYVSSEVPFEELKNDHFTYISTTLTNLHFTGYVQKFFGYTNGYYYYTFEKDQCIFVLLAPATCEEGLPEIEKIQVRVRIIERFADYDALTAKLAKDLEWTTAGIQSYALDYLLSEPGFHKLTSLLLLGFYCVSAAYALLNVCICILCISFPMLSTPCRKLGLYGNAKELLAQAEEELVTLPQLATEDMYITEHFFIMLAKDQVAVIPIREIIWIYKHSTLHKILGYHFSISYTLHITANKRLYLQCSENVKSDIDGIIDYLCEANHEILVGFDEKNRQQVHRRLGIFGFCQK